MTKKELIAILEAYRATVAVSCPDLHPDMGERSAWWGTVGEPELRREIDHYLTLASALSCDVRIFFKMGSELVYGGCNRQFAFDAGLASAAEMVGRNDFDPRIAWVAQAAKYRRDDRAVLESGQPKLGIIERQASASGVIWLDTSKQPIRDGQRCIGVFGTYAVIDAKTASRRMLARQR